MIDDGSMERWRGGVDATQEAHATALASHGVTVAGMQQQLTAMQIQMATLKTQVGVWSAVGGLIGAGIVSAAVALIA